MVKPAIAQHKTRTTVYIHDTNWFQTRDCTFGQSKSSPAISWDETPLRVTYEIARLYFLLSQIDKTKYCYVERNKGGMMKRDITDMWSSERLN